MRIDVGGGTYLPISFTTEFTAELPYRLLARADVGWMPAFYSNTLVWAAKQFNAINTFEEDLIKAAIKNSLVVNASLGVRPFSSLGLELYAGYTLFTIGGSISSADLVTSYNDAKGLSNRVPPGTKADVPLRATLHNLQITLAWRFLLNDEKLVLRPSLSYLQTLGSKVGVELESSRPVEKAAVDKLNSELEAELGPLIKKYVKAPLIGLTLAYRF